MPPSDAPTRSLRAALRGAALHTADVALAQGRRAFFSLQQRTRAWQGRSEGLTRQVVRLGERAIAKSPLPMPQLAHDALTRMQEALIKLEHMIDTGDVQSVAKGEQIALRQKGSVQVVAAKEQAVTPVLRPQKSQAPRASN